MKSYVVEKHVITDEKGRVAGSFLSVRDNSDEARRLRREMENASHDSLTKVYNRAGYEVLLSQLDLQTSCMIILDIDYFKTVNDTYGHETGDKILRKAAGGVVVVAKDGQIVYEHAAGTANKKDRTPLTPEAEMSLYRYFKSVSRL